MQHAPVLDRPRPRGQVGAADLLVLWQHPDTREFIPIGRFGFDGNRYTFVYTQAALQVTDLRPLPGLDDLHSRYEDMRMPPVFAQRVMSERRRDYVSYMDSLGLRHPTPWEQIVRSGGRRGGDTLQFMQLPIVAEGRARAEFLVNGIRHIPERGRKITRGWVHATRDELDTALSGLGAGDEVSLACELENSHDPNAVLVMSGRTPLGWVPRPLARGVRELLGAGPVGVTVYRIAPPRTPDHVRLALAFDVAVPEGFSFDPDGRWEPAPGGVLG